MSRLTDLLQQLFQLLHKLQGSQPRSENKPSAETKPPVMETKPPVMETKPPVMETKPPVTETKPPVAETRPTDPQPLNAEQNLNALSIFGTTAFAGVEINHVEFLDKNTDGKVSEGDDILLFSKTDEQTGRDDRIRERPEVSYSQRRTLTAAEADQINQPVKPELQLNSDQQRAAFEEIFPNSYKQKGSVVDIRDNNGDGKVSEGDTAIHRVRHEHGSSEVGRVFLDAETAGRFEQSARPEIPLEISTHTLDALKQRFSFNGPDATVIDKNNDGELSAGDILRLSVPNGQHLRDITLTQEDVDVIKGNVDMLKLSAEQNTALEDLLNNRTDFSNNVQKTVFTGKLLDRDGNGKISVGDGAITSTQNFVGDRPITTALQAEHTLTVEDIAKIGSASVNTKIVSGGGVSVGENLTLEGIPDDRIVDIDGRRYSVGFLKEQVEDFAESSYANQPSDGGLVAQVAGRFDWGYSGLSSVGHAFERYITDTFPRGEATDAPDGDIDYASPVSESPKALSLTD